MTVNRQNRAAFNEHTIGPAISFPERARQQVDVTVAVPRRNSLGERSGQRYSEWGRGFEKPIAGTFFYAQHDATSGASHTAYEAVMAGQAAGRQEPGATNPPPTWAAVPQASLDAFESASNGDPGRARSFSYQRRPGANPAPIAPLDGLTIGTTRYMSVVAPADGGRGRRNAADVSDR